MAPPCRPLASGRRASSRPIRRRTRRRRAPATPTRRFASRATATTVTSSSQRVGRRSPRRATTTRPTSRPIRPAGWGGVQRPGARPEGRNAQDAAFATPRLSSTTRATPTRRCGSTARAAVARSSGQRLLWRCRQRATATRHASRAHQGSGGLTRECRKKEREPVPRDEGGLTARHGPVGRFWVGRPAGHRHRSPTRKGG